MEQNLEQSCHDNRELSWLKFNTRVLEEAEDETNPLCERLSFASIYQTNLDEFFGVRVGSLYDQMLVSPDMRDKNTHMTCQEQIDAVFRGLKAQTKRKDNCISKLTKELRKYGVYIQRFSEFSKEDKAYLNNYFQNQVRPLLAPQVVGKKQPFPFLKDKAIYAAVVLGAKKTTNKPGKNGKPAKSSDKLGIVPCSIEVLPRLVPIPSNPGHYILMEDLILHYLGKVFPHFKVMGKCLFRIVRNADIDPDEDVYGDDTDFRQVMEQLVSRRRRLAPIKLDYALLTDSNVLAVLTQHLSLEKNAVFRSTAPLDLSYFSDVRDMLRGNKELFYEKYTPRWPSELNPKRKIIDQVEKKDRLLFYPYENMEPLLQLLNEAASDPRVVSIKMTLYRVARNSRVIDALIRAAENGKEVNVLVELRARFDEANNIGWSRRLEEAGCSILYGLDDLKVHAKLCLITRTDENGIHYITHVGTGNFNEKTAGLYTDLSLLTANQQIGEEVSEIFMHLYLDEVEENAGCLMVAPRCLRNRVLDRIDRQIEQAKEGRSAYIGGKMNSLTDDVIINRLIEASKAGVRIELVIRGACCLIAGVPGETENVEVRSIVGRYLEHSRIFIFGSGEDEAPEVFIGSADYMTRNTTRRVEVAAPIFDPDIRARLLDMFHILMEDNVKARIQQPDGTYVHVKRAEGEEPLNAQEYFMQPWEPKKKKK